MTWLMLQTIIWCAIGFAIGALAAWLLGVMLWPHEKDFDERGYYRPLDETDDDLDDGDGEDGPARPARAKESVA
ncbi:hypothetical protein G9U51_10765 [Calidifontibacter sp. DB0510]|uniref:LapA family protein n=1 Tax=Metallococcus carri TaxID=1656884 RepID=A0A967AZZ9_9MICO|nr:hypothetical protein [Metallococcus carri]NHN56256.1 hypothetical protein [Metallococcus carri]NOP38692.1 hypothetical protein [Calidifontibacter sp. DB2511S]